MNKRSDPEVIFYVSNGPAYCIDCYNTLPKSIQQHCIAVYEDGTNYDGFGLICDCGEYYEMKDFD